MFIYFQVLLFGVSIYFLIKFFIKIYLEWYFDYWKVRNVNGPKPLPFLGTLPKHEGGIKNILEEMHEIYMQYKSTERFVGIFVRRDPKLFILDPQLAIEILTTHFNHFRNNESSLWTHTSIEQMRTQSPFVATEVDWKDRRAELTPAITNNRLRAFHLNWQHSGEKLVNYLKTIEGQNVDALELANKFTADAMINFIWGLEENTFDNKSIIHEQADKMMDQATNCVGYFNNTSHIPWLRYIKRERFFPQITDKFFTQLTRDALEARRNNPQLERIDVLNHLLQLKDKKSLNDTQIAGHATSLVVDGYATSGVIIMHTLILIARNTRVQQKLHEELIQKDEYTFEELNELPYLDACIQEALRIFPGLPTLFKICTKEITLKNTNGREVTLKPNDRIYISAYSFQHDPDYFENPEEYWPERFDEQFGGQRKYRDMGVFLPFGHGPRICPGNKLALYQAKVMLLHIMKNYKMTIGGKTRLDNKISTKPFLFLLDGEHILKFEKLKA